MTDLAPYLEFASTLCDGARAILETRYRAVPEAEWKADQTPVTVADREVETFLRDAILGAYPEHGILGEEHGSVRLDAEYVWALDPIDGTKSFAAGKPLFTTLIGLCRNGVPVVGAIEAPGTGERWLGATGLGTIYQEARVQTAADRALDTAVLTATHPDMFEGGRLAAFEALSRASRYTLYGSDAYGYGQLARGDLHLVCEADLKPFDWCALVPVVQGAGGTITDWSGAPLTLSSDGTALAAAGPALHQAALEILRR